MCNYLDIRLLLMMSCFQWFKDTKMKADHNVCVRVCVCICFPKIVNLNKNFSDFPTILYLYTLFFIHEY